MLEVLGRGCATRAEPKINKMGTGSLTPPGNVDEGLLQVEVANGLCLGGDGHLPVQDGAVVIGSWADVEGAAEGPGAPQAVGQHDVALASAGRESPLSWIWRVRWSRSARTNTSTRVADAWRAMVASASSSVARRCPPKVGMARSTMPSKIRWTSKPSVWIAPSAMS